MPKPARWKQFTDTIKGYMGRVYVGTSDAEIETSIRAAIQSFRIRQSEYSVSRATEDACVRYALKLHEENRELYQSVMGGSLARKRRINA